MKHKVLCVDDTPENLEFLIGLLQPIYDVMVVPSGAHALAALEHVRPDVILLDVMMPEMDGYEVCQRLKADLTTKHIPIIFLTGKTQPEDEAKALRMGANDYISKPINPPLLLARVHAQIAVKQWYDFLQQRNEWLEQQISKRLQDIDRLQDGSLFVMVSLAEFRDEGTGNHIRRTQKYVELLAQAAKKHPYYEKELDHHRLELIVKSAPLHDIGKITIPDDILLKPGNLSADEFDVMKSHVQRGHDIIVKAADAMGEMGEYLRIAQSIILTHHEKWDGSGYPQGLVAEEIPLEGRIMAIADVYDALRSARPYKEPMSHNYAMTQMRFVSGSHFDPTLFALFEKLDHRLDDINQTFSDE